LFESIRNSHHLSRFRSRFARLQNRGFVIALQSGHEICILALHMTKDELQKLDNDLEQEEKSLIDQLNRIANKNPQAKGDFTVRVPNYGDEDDENTQETIDLDKNFALTQELESKLNSIKKTRQKIKEGIYGKCDNCGSDIAPERLKAVPEAHKCITCAI